MRGNYIKLIQPVYYAEQMIIIKLRVSGFKMLFQKGLEYNESFYRKKKTQTKAIFLRLQHMSVMETSVLQCIISKFSTRLSNKRLQHTLCQPIHPDNTPGRYLDFLSEQTPLGQQRERTHLSSSAQSSRIRPRAAKQAPHCLKEV